MKARQFFLLLSLISIWILSSSAFPGREIPNHSTISPSSAPYRRFNTLLKSIASDSIEIRIIKIQNFIKEHPRFERAYLRLMEWYLLSDKKQEARTFYQQLATRLPYRHNSYWMLARLFLFEDDFPRARAAYEEALSITHPSPGLLREYADLLYRLSDSTDVQNTIGKLPLNENYRKLTIAFYLHKKLSYQKAIDLFGMLPENLAQDPVVLHYWGDCYYRQSFYKKADILWRKGLRIAQGIGDLDATAQFLSNLGVLAKKFGKYDLALSYYDSAYAIASQVGDMHRMELSLGNLGSLHKDRAEYDAALRCFKDALRISIPIGDFQRTAVWYSGSAQSLLYLGRFSDALQNYDLSEKYARRAKNEERLILVKLDKSDLYSYLNQFALARKEIQEAYDLAGSKELKYAQYRAKVRLMDLLIQEEKYEEARKTYREYIEVLKFKSNLLNRAYWTGRIAETYLGQKHYQSAKDYFQQAVQLATEAGSEYYTTWYILKIARIEINQGNLDAAIQILKEIREFQIVKQNNDLQAAIYDAFGTAYRKAHDISKAISAYQRAADIIEQTRTHLKVEQFRIGYFSEAYKVYRSLAECYFLKYKQTAQITALDSLLYYEERGRSRALKDLRLKNVSYQHNSNYLEACQRLSWIQRQLRTEGLRIYRSEKWFRLLSLLEASRYSLIAQRLRLIEQEIAEPENVPTPQSGLTNIFHNLEKAGFALLLYHISEEQSFALVAYQGKKQVVELKINRDSLQKSITRLMSPFHRAYYDLPEKILFKASIAHKLYKSLFKPAEKAADLPHKLLIIPDMELTNLPFEMLLVASPRQSQYSPTDVPDYAKDFLLHRYTFVYSPGLVILREGFKPLPSRPQIAVFANPVTAAEFSAQTPRPSRFRSLLDWRFEPLPFSELEAQRIKNVYSSTQVFKRQQATKTAFKTQTPRLQVIHVASHGFVDTTFDAFTGLALAMSQDSTDDGLLMGYEIADLKLQSDLVVLSACETGRGKHVAGEGVLGLPRLFLGAGANTVLMTLWKVDDKFTADFMPKFYDYLLKQNLSKAEALSRAKRDLLDSEKPPNGVYYTHPFYWASFTMFGDPGLTRPSSSKTVLYAGIVLLIVMFSSSIFIVRRRKKGTVVK